jgi:hypothetical protein
LSRIVRIGAIEFGMFTVKVRRGRLRRTPVSEACDSVGRPFGVPPPVGVAPPDPVVVPPDPVVVPPDPVVVPPDPVVVPALGIVHVNAALPVAPVPSVAVTVTE